MLNRMEDNNSIQTEPSLFSHVSKQTERKEPSAPIASPSGTGAENFWGSDEDFPQEIGRAHV